MYVYIYIYIYMYSPRGTRPISALLRQRRRARHGFAHGSMYLDTGFETLDFGYWIGYWFYVFGYWIWDPHFFFCEFEL